MMAGYIYDLAQLIHQLKVAPLTIIGHSLGGNIALRYSGLYPKTWPNSSPSRDLGRARKCCGSARPSPSPSACARWIGEQRALSGRVARRYSIDRGCLQTHAGGEWASVRRNRRGI
mgnify:CR=1 FL=1